MEPEIHGNPVDPDNGALCYRYFAWDVIDDLENAGFSEKTIVNYWSEDYAYLGRGGFIIMAKKGA
jgi:hypothetical protein